MMHAELSAGMSFNERKNKGTGDNVEEEEKREISLVQQTFYPDSNTKEGHGEEENVHNQYPIIDDDKSDYY